VYMVVIRCTVRPEEALLPFSAIVRYILRVSIAPRVRERVDLCMWWGLILCAGRGLSAA